MTVCYLLKGLVRYRAQGTSVERSGKGKFAGYLV